MTSKANCPICGSHRLEVFYRQEQVPVHQNLLVDDQGAAETVDRGDLTLAFCNDCGFVFNQTFEISKLGYGVSYDNTQTHSPCFSNYIDGLARRLLFERGVQNCRIVEVGCGNGTFLRKLIEADNSGNVGYGFDPSYSGPEVALGGRLRFEKRFYGPVCTSIPVDVVVCRHVIEHVPDPLGLLSTVRQALVNSLHARVFLETPCTEWILRNSVIWDFFYEHCSYFNAECLTTVLALTGFKVESVQNAFDGQYLWVEGRVSSERPPLTKGPGSIPYLARQFAMSVRCLKQVLIDGIETLAGEGKVALWGAGAKGATLANLIDPERRRIACVADLNPGKQGRFIPGTGHPIVRYQDLAEMGVKTAILMNPNYCRENLLLLKESQQQIRLIDLMDLLVG